VTIAIVLALFGESLLGSLPNQKVVADRYSTIGNIQDDGSFKGRVMLLGIAIRKTATAPLGYGIGSGGLASRVSGSQGGEVADSTGYLQIMTTFGWIGGTMIFAVLLQLWKSSSYVWRNNPKDPDAALFRAWFVSGMVVLFSGNWLAGVSYFWLLAGYVIGQEDLVRAKKRKKRRTKKGRSVRDRDDGELDQSSEASPGRMPVEGSTPNVSLDS
jgi:O-antigen ligase